MKTTLKILIIVILLSGVHHLYAQNDLNGVREIERLYVTTDRDSYIAGETIWTSVYCFDISESNFKYSNLSKVVYLELHNAEGMVSTGKIFMIGGRGGGCVELPINIPTANYKLVAYTKYMLNEESVQLFQRDIPIVSPLTGAKVKDNVKIVDNYYEGKGVLTDQLRVEESSSLDVKIDNQELDQTTGFTLSLLNKGDDPLSLSISVYRNDKFFSDNRKDKLYDRLKDYQKAGKIIFNDRFIPEYEGEIIKGRVVVEDGSTGSGSSLSMAAIGKEINLYFSQINSSSEVAFYTQNLTGKSEIVIEPYNSNELERFRIEFEEPFINYNPISFNPVYLAKTSVDVIEERLFEMQVSRRFELYKSVEEIFEIHNPLMSVKSVTYRLDDYKRFMTLHETIIEYIVELQFRKIFDQYGIRSYIDAFYSDPDAYDEVGTTKVLLLFDGVPIYDHSVLADYDAYKIESIKIIPRRLYLNRRYYEGVVLINSFGGKLDGVQMGKNAIVLDYNAPQLASRFTYGSMADSNRLPDVRSLLFWDPVLDINGDEEYKTTVRTSTMPGEYCIEIEGLSAKGEPIYIKKYFTVGNSRP